MKKRKVNISFTKSGAGNRSTRLILPVKWVDHIGVTQENREVYIYQFGDSILIKKTPLKWDKKQAFEYNLADIKNILDSKGWISYDKIGEIIENTLKAYFNGDEREEKNHLGSVVGSIDEFLAKHCEVIRDGENDKWYYCKKELGIKTFEEFQTFLQKEENNLQG